MGHPFKTQGVFAVPYSEYHEGYDEDYQTDHVACERILFCDWNNRRNFAQDLVGWSHLNSDGSIERHLPEPHPEYAHLDADDKTMRCTGAKLIKSAGVWDYDPGTGAPQCVDRAAPFTPGDTDTVNIVATNDPDAASAPVRWGYAYFRTSWAFPLFDVLSDEELDGQNEFYRYTEVNSTYGGQNLPLPGNTFCRVGAPSQKIPEGVPKFYPEDQWTITFHEVPADGFLLPAGLQANINACRGRVNSRIIPGIGTAGTLLCLNPDIKRYRTASDGVAFRITYVWDYRRNTDLSGVDRGHNGYFMRSPVPDFYAITTDPTGAAHPYPATDGSNVYNDADFALLFSCVAGSAPPF